MINWERCRLNCWLKNEIHTVSFSVTSLVTTDYNKCYFCAEQILTPRNRPAGVRSNRHHRLSTLYCRGRSRRSELHRLYHRHGAVCSVPLSPIDHLGGENLMTGILQSVAGPATQPISDTCSICQKINYIEKQCHIK
jgi:hypothetical protein